nr:IS5 family transposase [Streptomyces kebangsaanensis]
MGRGDLSNEEWALLGFHLPKNVGCGGRWKNHRRVINGILFRQRTGIPWRDLPTRFGKWKTVHDRHRRWSADGTWDRILRAVQADADAEGRIDWSMASVDSTVCRAHQHAAGACKQAPRKPGKRTQPVQHRPDEALGRSRGGLSTKIHLVPHQATFALSTTVCSRSSLAWRTAVDRAATASGTRVPRRPGRSRRGWPPPGRRTGSGIRRGRRVRPSTWHWLPRGFDLPRDMEAMVRSGGTQAAPDQGCPVVRPQPSGEQAEVTSNVQTDIQRRVTRPHMPSATSPDRARVAT